jgi:hypothetical protein
LHLAIPGGIRYCIANMVRNPAIGYFRNQPFRFENASGINPECRSFFCRINGSTLISKP